MTGNGELSPSQLPRRPSWLVVMGETAGMDVTEVLLPGVGVRYEFTASVRPQRRDRRST